MAAWGLSDHRVGGKLSHKTGGNNIHFSEQYMSFGAIPCPADKGVRKTRG
jgi:hypothetical protein